MELYKEYRPKTLDEVVGQDSQVKMLQGMIKKNNIPHTLLLTGPSGCGKTTIARILRKELKCSKYDFIELNCANFRGIDTVRTINQRMMQAPMRGNTRIWLIDECFTADTIIETPKGSKYIQNIKLGDSVYSSAGVDKVTNIFTKHIPLNRLTKIKTTDGKILYCSDGHEFYTDNGWVHAKDLLKNDLLFSFNCNIVHEIEKDKNEKLQKLRHQIKKQKTPILWKVMCNSFSVSKKGNPMPRLWKNDCDIFETTKEIQPNILQSKLFSDRQNKPSCIQEKIIQQNNSEKNKSSEIRILQNRQRKRTGNKIFQKDEDQQPYARYQNNRKNKTNKRKKWNFTPVERQTGRQWTLHRTTIKIMETLEGWLGIRICNNNQQKVTLPTQLQSRYRRQQKQNSNRDRWQGTSFEESYAKRCKKRKIANTVRVESVEVYKRRSNEQSFTSVIGNKEKNSNHITLYDIEMEQHPSYFANGILVHNCHKLSGDAQNAFLKILEDTPKHVYFMLATTHPQKLLNTIITRATKITVKPILPKVMAALIDTVAGEEEIDITDTVIDKIVEVSDGSARTALVMLNSIMNIEGESSMMEVVGKVQAEGVAIQIARAMVNPNTKWAEMRKLLKENDGEDAEGLRWMILGYAKAMLLSGAKHPDRYFLVIDACRDNFYDSKYAGLVAACYEVVVGVN